MDWVKQTTDYYRDAEIAVGDDAMEVMFTRGNSLAGEIERSGFIPDAMLHYLTRRPQHAKRTASALVKADLWERVPGGYQIVNWHKIQSELEKLLAKKKRDRDRKRRSRGQSADTGADTARDGHEDRLYDSESKSKTAAAAAGDAAAAADGDADQDDPKDTGPGLPVSVDILRSKLQATTALAALRFDQLRPAQVTQIETLIGVHGDDRLVDVARDTCRTPAPTSVAAFIGTWEHLPPPGRTLHAVAQRLCDVHATRLSPAGVCGACEADRKVGG